MLRSTLLPGLLMALLLATGCNVFDGLEEEGASDDPALLLQDAELALSRGEANRAERYLRRALQLDPENNRVRVKLSTTLLAKHDINALDLMRIARALHGVEDDAAAPPTNALRPALRTAPPVAVEAGAVCSFDTTAVQRFQAFQPREIERFNLFQPSQDALEEIRSLIGRVFDENETQIGDFDGRTIQAVIDSLRNAESPDGDPFTDAEIAEAAINDAVATTTLAYLDLSADARASYAYYYVDPDTTQGGDRYLGYCADTQPQYDEAEQVVACNEPGLRYTRNLLRARADSLLPGSSVAAEIADEAELGYNVLYQQVDPASCGSGPSALRAAR